MAEQESKSLRFWFRQKYNLPPHDPRYTAMTDEEISLEYELHLAADGKRLHECTNCGMETHRDECPCCTATVSGDKVIDDVFSKIAAGEHVDPQQLDALLRGQAWEPITFEGEP